MSASPLVALQEWFHGQCNGHWEHMFGIVLETADNPGWLLKIEVEGTPLDGQSWKHKEDGFEIEMTDGLLMGYSQPLKLDDMLRVIAEHLRKEES